MAENPIQKKHRERMLAAKRNLVKADDVVRRCENCGQNMDSHKEAIMAIDQALDLVLENFGQLDPAKVNEFIREIPGAADKPAVYD